MVLRLRAASLPADTRVPYPLDVSERKVDREAWASAVAVLIEQEAGGNKSAFARLLGGTISAKTIERWLNQTVNVSEESVRQVCRTFNIPLADMLVRIGYIRLDEIPVAEPSPLRAADERAIAAIEASDLPPSLKRELLDHLRQQQAFHEKQRLEEIERLLALALRGQKRAG